MTMMEIAQSIALLALGVAAWLNCRRLDRLERRRDD